MTRTELYNSISNKVEGEFAAFEEEMMSLSAADVYANAYKIVLYETIWRVMRYKQAEILDEVSTASLAEMLGVSNLLDWLYDCWVHNDHDSSDDDVAQCLASELKIRRLPRPLTNHFS